MSSTFRQLIVLVSKQLLMLCPARIIGLPLPDTRNYDRQLVCNREVECSALRSHNIASSPCNNQRKKDFG